MGPETSLASQTASLATQTETRRSVWLIVGRYLKRVVADIGLQEGSNGNMARAISKFLADLCCSQKTSNALLPTLQVHEQLN